MKSLQPSITGLLWGLGFSFATLLVYSAYAVTLLGDIERSYKETLAEIIGEDVREFNDILTPEVITHKVIGNALLIKSRTKRISTALSLRHKAYMRFTLFSNEQSPGAFLGNCSQELISEGAESEWTYYETECGILLGNINDVVDIRVSIVNH